MKLEFSRQMFEKYLNTKFNKNPPSGRRAVPCGRTARWTCTHNTRLTVAYCNSANMPKTKNFGNNPLGFYKWTGGKNFNKQQIQCYSAVSDFTAGHHIKPKCLLFRNDPIQINNFVLLVHKMKLGTPSSHASQTQKHSEHVLMWTILKGV